jgi:quercetin dioxygenase-like cupin family protein
MIAPRLRTQGRPQSAGRCLAAAKKSFRQTTTFAYTDGRWRALAVHEMGFEPAGSDAAPAQGAHERSVLAHELSPAFGKKPRVELFEVGYGPGGSTPSHRYGCPVVGYVLRGALRMQFQGEPTRVYGPGEAFYEDPSDLHTLSENAGQGETRFLAFFVCDDDRPLYVKERLDDDAQSCFVRLRRPPGRALHAHRAGCGLPRPPFARTIHAARKYVVSSTLDRVDWNAELVRGDLANAVQDLKRESGHGLFVGGVTLPLALAELGLIDEYEFVVQPVLAGHGPTLFAGLSKRVDLKLVGRREFGSGAVAMRYEPRR